MSLDITVWNANYSWFLFREGRETEREIFFQSINRECTKVKICIEFPSLSFEARQPASSIFRISIDIRGFRRKDKFEEKKKKEKTAIDNKNNSRDIWTRKNSNKR